MHVGNLKTMTMGLEHKGFAVKHKLGSRECCGSGSGILVVAR